MKAVASLAGEPVQTYTGGHQSIGRVEFVEVRVGKERGANGGRPQQRDVAESAATLLEVGLEEKGDVAHARMAFCNRVAQLAEPAFGEAAPFGEATIDELPAEVRFAGHGASADQPQRGPEVAPSDGDGLLDRLDAVVEAHAGVPDRIPQVARDLGDVAPAPVDEDDVDVTARRELAASVASHRHDGNIGGVAEEFGQPACRRGRNRRGRTRFLGVGRRRRARRAVREIR